MTRIRASCPSCGEVDLQPPDVTLRIVRSDEGLVGEGSCYRFVCPDCDDLVTKPADERIAQLLSTGGVEIEGADVEDGAATLPPHPERPPAGPAFTADDLLDLHLLLQEGSWFDELVSASR